MNEAKPRIVITYCTQCQWLLRAGWMAQELLSSFGADLGEVTLVPGTGGVFTINTKFHEGARVWLASRRLLVNGQRTIRVRGAAARPSRISQRSPPSAARLKAHSESVSRGDRGSSRPRSFRSSAWPSYSSRSADRR